VHTSKVIAAATLALATTHASANPTKPQPCPKDLGKRLAPLYGDRGGPIDVVIAACTWGSRASRPGEQRSCEIQDDA